MTAALIVYGIGWVIMSLIGGFMWLLGFGFNQDNMATFAYEQAKLTMATFFLIWFWPIAIPTLMLIQKRDERRIAERNRIYREKQMEKVFKTDGQD
ncbi:membrane protein [Streptomyces phage LilMartin]|nr:membrane protein [Streptomyces phage LilMartin]QNO12624.1 membrane protein [Streptomyces phage MulchMansion]UVK61292.1 membrane protein [Streptomyces phage Angela]